MRLDKSAKGFILWGIPIIFLSGSLLHFVYSWSGENTFAGIFAPVNESVWEHLKMSFWPGLIWWLLGLNIPDRKGGPDTGKWIISASAAILLCPIIIISLYYTLLGAFKIDSIFADIAYMLLGIGAGQLLGYHYYKYGCRAKIHSVIIFLLIISLLFLAFVVFTFYPPHIPLLLDKNTGSYGI